MSLDFALFDLDGVLVDSRVPISRCLNAALEAEGLAPEPVERLYPLIGPPLDTAFRGILQARGESADAVDVLVAHYRERYASVSLTDTVLMPGIVDMLDALEPVIEVGVATAKPAAFARPILEKLGVADRFLTIAGPPVVGSHLEPKSETVARARDAIAPGSVRGVMIGDRALDVEAGRANDLLTVTVGWGIGERAELEAAGPDHHADSAGALTRFLITRARRGRARRGRAGRG